MTGRYRVRAVYLGRPGRDVFASDVLASALITQRRLERSGGALGYYTYDVEDWSRILTWEDALGRSLHGGVAA